MATEIDPSVELKVERTARAEANRARAQAVSVLAAFALVVGAGSGLGIWKAAEDKVDDTFDTWIHGAAQEQIKQSVDTEIASLRDSLSKMRQQAEEHVEDIVEKKELADKATERMAEQQSETGLIDLVHKIETRRYNLTVSDDAGWAFYETNVSIAEYPAAAISAWRLTRETTEGEGISCDYSDLAEIFMDRGEPTWRIRVDKSKGCNRVYLRVIYIPASLVGDVHNSVTLEKIEGQ